MRRDSSKGDCTNQPSQVNQLFQWAFFAQFFNVFVSLRTCWSLWVLSLEVVNKNNKKKTHFYVGLQQRLQSRLFRSWYPLPIDKTVPFTVPMCVCNVMAINICTEWVPLQMGYYVKQYSVFRSKVDTITVLNCFFPALVSNKRKNHGIITLRHFRTVL